MKISFENSQELFITFKGEVIKISKGSDGLFRDGKGTVYAIADSKYSVDAKARCGVGIFSLPIGHPLNDSCKPHDYMYSSEAFQIFNTRLEADNYLRRLIKQSSGFWYLARPFYLLSRIFGGFFWENKDTRRSIRKRQ